MLLPYPRISTRSIISVTSGSRVNTVSDLELRLPKRPSSAPWKLSAIRNRFVAVSAPLSALSRRLSRRRLEVMTSPVGSFFVPRIKVGRSVQVENWLELHHLAVGVLFLRPLPHWNLRCLLLSCYLAQRLLEEQSLIHRSPSHLRTCSTAFLAANGTTSAVWGPRPNRGRCDGVL